jgi:hypothetical protein
MPRDFEAIEARRHAAERLRAIDTELGKKFGVVGRHVSAVKSSAPDIRSRASPRRTATPIGNRFDFGKLFPALLAPPFGFSNREDAP